MPHKSKPLPKEPELGSSTSSTSPAKTKAKTADEPDSSQMDDQDYYILRRLVETDVTYVDPTIIIVARAGKEVGGRGGGWRAPPPITPTNTTRLQEVIEVLMY